MKEIKKECKADNLFVNTLLGNKQSKTPIWFMRQAGRYLEEYRNLRASTNNFMEFCYNAEKASEATLQPIDRFGFDAAIIFSDILVIPDAIGADVTFQKGMGPIVKCEINDAFLDKAKFDSQKLENVYKAISLTRSRLSEDKSLIGFAGAPWTLATYMIEGGTSRDFEKTKRLAYRNEKLFSRLIDVLTESVADHLILQIKSGANALQIFDSWSGVLTEDQFKKWSIDPIKKITSKIKAEFPDIPIIGFPKGAGVMYKEYAKETGVNAISFDQNISRNWIHDNIDLTVQGNLDPVLLTSNLQGALHQVDDIMSVFADKPFVFNLGHGILPDTPVENVKAVIDRVRQSV